MAVRIAAFQTNASMQKEETMSKVLAIILMVTGVLFEAYGFNMFNE